MNFKNYTSKELADVLLSTRRDFAATIVGFEKTIKAISEEQQRRHDEEKYVIRKEDLRPGNTIYFHDSPRLVVSHGLRLMQEFTFLLVGPTGNVDGFCDPRNLVYVNSMYTRVPRA